MSAQDYMLVGEDKPAKRYWVYWMVKDQPHSVVAEYDTDEALRRHRGRLDRIEAVFVRKMCGTTYVPVRKFLDSLT